MKIAITLFVLTISLFAQTKLKVLISGFEPFGGYSTNPTQEMVRYIQNNSLDIENVEVKAITLPVTYFESWDILKKNIDNFQPNIVLAFGYAPSSSKIRLEAIAKNYDGGYKDNLGKSHLGEIVKNGTRILKSQLPIDELKDYLVKQGFDINITKDAGSYICNHLFYNLTTYIQNKNITGGFIHVPNIEPYDKYGTVSLIRNIIEFIKLEK